MRRTYWYHEECLSQVETAVRTSKSPHHEICAKCGYEGLCVEAELVTNPDVRKIEAAAALIEVAVEAEPEPIIETGRPPLDIGLLPDGPAISKVIEIPIPEMVEEVIAQEVKEMPLEAESTEEKEAVLIAAGEAVEDIVEVIEREKESPEEMAPAEAVEPIAEEVAAPSPEEEAEAESEHLEAAKAAGARFEAEEAKKANIARLEAELEALKKR